MNSVYRRFHKVLPNPCIDDILYTIVCHEAVKPIHERAFCTRLPEECFTRFLRTVPMNEKSKNRWSRWGKTFNKLSLNIFHSVCQTGLANHHCYISVLHSVATLLESGFRWNWIQSFITMGSFFNCVLLCIVFYYWFFLCWIIFCCMMYSVGDSLQYNALKYHILLWTGYTVEVTSLWQTVCAVWCKSTQFNRLLCPTLPLQVF